MNVKHNTRLREGLEYAQLQVGKVYLCLMPNSRPRVYMACTNPGHNGLPKVDFLVNMETGCRVVPATNRQYGWRLLPDATLDTGT